MATLGIVTGGIYEDYPPDQSFRSFKQDGDRILNEFQGLGAKWIRIEARWRNVADETYRNIVRKARQRGIKVIVLLAGDEFGRFTGRNPATQQPENLDQYIDRYRNELNRLMTTVFNAPDTRPDALELTNEPNQNDPGTPSGSRLGGNEFAWLIRRVWEWKTQRGWPDIITGGTINTYFTNESWWQQFFASGAWSDLQRTRTRPFNYFGVHPYNSYSIDPAYFDRDPPYDTNVFGAWKETTKGLLKDLSVKLDQVTGTSGTRLFVTEFGWMMPDPAKPGTTRWTYVPLKNCVMSLEQEAAGMAAAVQAFDESGVVSAALWYSYRNTFDSARNETERYGLRRLYDPASNHYPHKPGVWQQFKQLAGGTGNNDPESYWR